MAASSGEARLLNGELVDGGARGAEEAVQFVHRAVGLDARAVLGDALAADERGLAAVALPRVDAVDGEAGVGLNSVSALIGLLRLIAPRDGPFQARDEVQFRRRESEDSSYWRLSALRRLP